MHLISNLKVKQKFQINYANFSYAKHSIQFFTLLLYDVVKLIFNLVS